MKPHECANCGAKMPRLIFENKRYAFRCMNCGSQSRYAAGFEEAIDAWNAGDWAWVERNHAVKELVDMNEGHCPCEIWQSDDTICPCKAFRDMEEGVCNCGRYEKKVNHE